AVEPLRGAADHDLQRVHQLRQLRARGVALDRARRDHVACALRRAPSRRDRRRGGRMSSLHPPAPLLFAGTAVVTVFAAAPMLVSVAAGLVNNYSVGAASGFTLRWLDEVWSQYGSTAWHSIVLALACVVTTVVIGVPCGYALARNRSRAARLFEELITL